MPSKTWDEITNAFPNFKGAAVEIWIYILYRIENMSHALYIYIYMYIYKYISVFAIILP